ncbi:Aspartate--tRNA ligase, mitochondrial [Echinococcus granulosus]|nr:Aspartate--tRNA ligase, mitochondrial [Echinococcus granulosus]
MSSSFLLIRDAYGITQVVLEPMFRLGLPPSDSVIRVHGVVQSRPPKDINKSMQTGEIEIRATKVETLNSASECIPFKMKERTGVDEQLGLKYRYLQLRQPEFQKRLRFRSEFLRKIRDYLCEDRGFIDVETPYLFKRTPGGAQEFIVPSQFRGQFYALPQSPQQFKQLLMVAGLDRYMQIARCFRDELARPDRQPEFTQLDIEASFISREDIYDIVESTLAYAWPEVCKYNEITEDLRTPFSRMSYDEAMKRYGSDKPDVRFDMELESSGCGESEQFAFFVIPAGYAKVLSKPFFSKMLSLVVEKDALSLSVLPYDKVKSIDEVKAAGLSHLKPGEVAILANGTDHPWRKALGTARVLTAKELDSKGVQIYKPGFFFHWVENFPLFSKNEIGDFVSKHHPFTAPVESEVDLLYTEPAMVRGQHYDLVCNGQEVGGGSLRIHRSDMQRYVLEHILHEDVTPLRHLLEALSFGAPPHGGIALGLDRLIAIFTNAQTVRDVIAFPKTAGGRDLLSNSPDTVPNTELDRYFIRVLWGKE